MLNPPPMRRPAPPPTWSQYFAYRRAQRGSVSPMTRWGYGFVLFATLIVLPTPILDLPGESSLYPAHVQSLVGHPAFVLGLFLLIAACVLAVIAAHSERPRSISLGLHAGILLFLAGLSFILGFVDTARRVAMLSGNEVGIGTGAIVAGALGVAAIAIAVADVVQLPDLRRIPFLRYAAGYSWAIVASAATMLTFDLRVGTSYAARASGLTTGPTDTDDAAINAGRLGLAASGLRDWLVVVAVVILAIAALAIFTRRPRRFAHVPAALIAGPLICLGALVLLLDVLTGLVSSSRRADRIAERLGISASEIHVGIAYGGWVLLVAAALTLMIGALCMQAGLATPRILPARRGPRPAPVRSAQMSPSVAPASYVTSTGTLVQAPPRFGSGLGPLPIPSYDVVVEEPKQAAEVEEARALEDRADVLTDDTDSRLDNEAAGTEPTEESATDSKPGDDEDDAIGDNVRAVESESADAGEGQDLADVPR